jgi:hypothetical protein
MLVRAMLNTNAAAVEPRTAADHDIPRPPERLDADQRSGNNGHEPAGDQHMGSNRRTCRRPGREDCPNRALRHIRGGGEQGMKW